MCEQIWNYAMPALLGFFVAVVLGQVVIGLTSKILYRKLGLEGSRKGSQLSAILGAAECVLYLGAFLLGRLEFIAVWLGLKTVVRWRNWETDIPIPQAGEKPKWILGRYAYNIFLLGNALVITFAAIGWKIIELARHKTWPEVIAIVAATLAGSLILIVWALLTRPEPPLPDSDPRVQRGKQQT